MIMHVIESDERHIVPASAIGEPLEALFLVALKIVHGAEKDLLRGGLGKRGKMIGKSGIEFFRRQRDQHLA